MLTQLNQKLKLRQRRSNMENLNTYFFDNEGRRIGSLFGITPIQNGMIIEVKGSQYKVESTKLLLADTSINDPLIGLHVFCVSL